MKKKNELYFGFYLSPCGNHIVQLKQNPKNKWLIDVFGAIPLFDWYVSDFFCDLFKPEALVIFSCWERLK